MDDNDDLGLTAMRRTIKSRIEEEKNKYGPEPEKGEKAPTFFFTSQCVNALDSGNGAMFAKLNRDRILYVNETDEFRFLDGHIWKRDFNHCVSLGLGVDAVREEYIRYAASIDHQILEAEKVGNTDAINHLRPQRKAVAKSIKMLNTMRGMNNCLAAAKIYEDMRVSEMALDADPYAIAFQNGYVDLRSGKFNELRPDKYFTKCCAASFEGYDCEPKLFCEIMLEIHDGRADLVEFLQRFFGMALIGIPLERKFLVLYGPGGQNGKGLYVGAVTHALGDYAGQIPSELLMAQRGPRNSAGPSPDIMALRGMRIAVASETEENGRFSAARVKWLTGGDPLVGRNPHDRYLQTFDPSHSLVLLTNHKPHVSSNDLAFWARVMLVPYFISFVDREPVSASERRARKDLTERLKLEASSILSWLIRGCLQYQAKGLFPPKLVIEGTAEYKREEDFLADFIDDCLEIDPASRERAKDLYEAFRDWYAENVSKKHIISNKKFGALLGQRFEKKKTAQANLFLGVKLRGHSL